MPKKKLLIVGGGIAGTTLAGLLQDSCDVTLIEEGKEWRTIGYAVGIWKSGLRILKKLDLPDSFWEGAFPSTQGAILGSREQTLTQMSFDSIGDGNITQAVTRESLHTALISKLCNVKVCFGTTVESLKQKGTKVEIILSNGNTEVYDLVVGADGVYSKTRAIVFGKKSLRSYDWFVWGGYIDRKYEHYSGWYALTGPGEFLLSFPITHKTNTVGIICHKSKFKDQKNISADQDLHKIFNYLDPLLKDSIDSIDNIHSLFFSELYFVEMKQWHKGRVVLAGDSRHARSPVSGMGTTLALEDAYVLADEIKKNTSIDVALGKYEKRRQKRVQFILIAIDFLERNVITKNKLRSALRDMFLPLVPAKFFIFLMKKIFQGKV